MTTIVKATTKGQVTLPAKWRRSCETNRFTVKESGDSLIITPLHIDVLEDEKWDTVFDAKRDNDGKGIPIDEFIGLLEKIAESDEVWTR